MFPFAVMECRMYIMRCKSVAVGALLIATILCGDARTFQDGDKPKAQLPAAWDSLKLTEEQARKIHEILKDYEGRIGDLEKQIHALRNRQRDDVAKVLTEKQKREFKDIPAKRMVVTAAYEVTIADVEKITDLRDPKDLKNPKQPKGRLDAMEGTIVFQEKSVPRGAATMIVDLPKGRKVSLDLLQEEGKNFPKGELTNRFTVSCMPIRDGFTLQQLRGCSARVYSRMFPPELKPVP
jgi:hypothetical protein